MKRAYTVELRSSPVRRIDDEIIDAFASAVFADRRLAGAAPAADLALHTLEWRTGVDAVSAAAAVGLAAASFTRAAKCAGLTVEIVEASVWFDDDERGDRQELLSGAEVARRLGISRQRVQQLASVAGRFLRPVATFGTVSAWRWGDIADWAQLSERRVSLPRRRRTT